MASAAAKHLMNTGLHPRVTGLPFWLWLVRQNDTSMPIIEVTRTQAYRREEATRVMLEPVLMVLDGSASPDEFDLDALGRWAAPNADLIEDYFHGLVSDDGEEVVRKVHKVGASPYG